MLLKENRLRRTLEAELSFYKIKIKDESKWKSIQLKIFIITYENEMVKLLISLFSQGRNRFTYMKVCRGSMRCFSDEKPGSFLSLDLIGSFTKIFITI